MTYLTELSLTLPKPGSRPPFLPIRRINDLRNLGKINERAKQRNIIDYLFESSSKMGIFFEARTWKSTWNPRLGRSFTLRNWTNSGLLKPRYRMSSFQPWDIVVIQTGVDKERLR
jgi:hypothetical protein